MIVAAFDPFGGRRRNRAADAAAHLAGVTILNRRVEVAPLPTVFAALPAALRALLAKQPQLLLLVGESAHTRALAVERVALNLADAILPDNAGAQPAGEPLEPGAELARRVVFDPRLAVRAALAAGVPCQVSSHAGTFCCNAALYHALGQAAQLPRPPIVAFVHVPAHWPWANDRRAARGLSAIAAALGQLI